ncbi:MAG: hypothetical protein K2J81_03890 [Treponemataceae bacterium]|nr:hypothetical protein [Treponemataceae bacterium]
MKKLLLVLACAASLGLWMSCENEPQELDVTLHSGVDTKTYANAGTVTATKVTMVTTRGEEVKYDDNDKITNQPTDKKYYIGTVQTLSEDGKEIVRKKYWFSNDWNAGESITFDMASVSWDDNVSYNVKNGADGSVGIETVSNAKLYTFSFNVIDNNGTVGSTVRIVKSGDVYQYNNDIDLYGTAKLDVKGSMEGNFTIGTLLKALDSNYSEEDKYGELGGSKYTRLDERTVYEERNGHYDSDSGEWVYEYVARKIPANTSVYYLKDVSFTKN